MSGSPLDRIHNFRQRIDFHGLLINQRREDHVNMIRHDYSAAKVELNSVVMQTAIEDNLPHMFRKNPPVLRAESYKVLPIIALQMRKLPSIKSLRHRVC